MGECTIVHVYKTVSMKELEFYGQLQKFVKNLELADGRQEGSDGIWSDCGVLLSEPYFQSSTLPWHDLLFLQQAQRNPHIAHFPSQFSIKAVFVNFRDLWKIRYPVQIKSDIDLTPMDEVIANALEV